jgi:V/A-type H+-transporting ATPase subunit C
MAETAQILTDFNIYPPIGAEDWRYAFATAQVRALEIEMLTRETLFEMANSQSFDEAVDLLGASEYALTQTHRSFAEMETILGHRRSEVRKIFEQLCIDEPIVELFKSRIDFANIRLALRRSLTEKPIGSDYSREGTVDPDGYEEIFEQNNYNLLGDMLRQAVDAAVLAYYQNKNVRQIDFALDKAQARFNLKTARELESTFLTELFRMQNDLTNIRIMLRQKFAESEDRDQFLESELFELDRLDKARDLGYEAIAPLFFASPYRRLVERGIAYLISDQSFLKIEQQCQMYINGYLKSTINITAGYQPLVAYLLLKENEIRTVRLILTAKKNGLENKLILDRIT